MIFAPPGLKCLVDFRAGPHANDLVSAHREETVDSPSRLSELMQSLRAVADEYDCPVIVPVFSACILGATTLHRTLDQERWTRDEHPTLEALLSNGRGTWGYSKTGWGAGF